MGKATAMPAAGRHLRQGATHPDSAAAGPLATESQVFEGVGGEGKSINRQGLFAEDNQEDPGQHQQGGKEASALLEHVTAVEDAE
jgi:hypothetical protein